MSRDVEYARESDRAAEPFKDPRGRPLEPTDAERNRWNQLDDRRSDPSYMRYLQSRRSHESLSESGKLGFAVTAERYGFDGAMEKAAVFWREHPERASEPEQRMMTLLRELGQEWGRDYRHIHKTAPGVWSDFAWPDRMKVIEVWGGVHTQEVLARLDPENSEARRARDERRIELMQERGWQVMIVMANQLEWDGLPATRRDVDHFLHAGSDEQRPFIPRVFEPGPERTETARKYAAERQVEDLLEEAGMQLWDYAREFRIRRELPAVGFAWLETKRAAEVYRDDAQERADEERIRSFHERGWQVLALREDRDLTAERQAITRDALVRWARREEDGQGMERSGR